MTQSASCALTSLKREAYLVEGRTW